MLQATPPGDEEDDEDEGVDDGDEDAEEERDGNASFTLAHITVCAYGVLGLNDLGRRAGVDPATAVAERFVLVDPAGPLSKRQFGWPVVPRPAFARYWVFIIKLHMHTMRGNAHKST